jgi:hypothetical protein
MAVPQSKLRPLPLPADASIQHKLEWYRVQFLALRADYMKLQQPDVPTGTLLVKLLVEARRCDELLAKLQDGDSATSVGGISAAQWERILQRLTAALDPFPEAKASVLLALEEAD